MIEYNDEWIIKTDNINLTDDAKTQEMTLYAFCMKGSSDLTYDGKALRTQTRHAARGQQLQRDECRTAN